MKYIQPQFLINELNSISGSMSQKTFNGIPNVHVCAHMRVQECRLYRLFTVTFQLELLIKLHFFLNSFIIV